jgi:hypothetical protein
LDPVKGDSLQLVDERLGGL